MTVPDALHESTGDRRARRRLLLPRYTIRLRLTVLYGGVFLILGAILLSIAYAGGSSFGARRVVAQAVAGAVVNREAVPAPSSRAAVPEAPESLTVTPQARAQEDQLGALAVNVHGSDQHQLLIWSGFALAIMAIASMVLGWVLAGRVLRPLHTITTAARRISASSLHERLGLAGPKDELRELGDTFDELLGRLESSFEAQRRFVANASHELRTPLTLERAILEVTLADPTASAASLRTACERVLEIGAQQERMIDALLTLARSEGGLERREPLLIDRLTSDALDERGEELGRRGLRLDRKLEPAPTTGDRRLIERLIANLIDNAIHHNSPHGWVTVTTALDAGTAVLTVANSGPLIEPTEAERLFQPFRQHGTERTGDRDRHGLGLSIVSAIATAHGATLTAQPLAAGGLGVEVKFAAASARDMATTTRSISDRR